MTWGVRLEENAQYRRKMDILLVVYLHLRLHNPFSGGFNSSFEFYKTSISLYHINLHKIFCTLNLKTL